MKRLTSKQIKQAEQYPEQLEQLSQIVTDVCDSDNRVNQNNVAQRVLLSMLSEIEAAKNEYDKLMSY